MANYTLTYDSELKFSKWVGYPDPNYTWEGEQLVYERIVKDEEGKDVTVKTYKDPIEIIADFKPDSKVFGVEGNIERNAVKKFGGALKGFVWLDKVSGGGEVVLPFTAPHIFIATGDRLNPELAEISTDPKSDNYYEVVEGKTRVVVKSFSGIGGAAGKPPELIAHYKMNENTAGDNAELVTGGDFSAWTSDNPNGWSVSGEISPSSHTIDGVNTTTETFTISDEGDLSTWFRNGNIFEVTSSTGNNGQWTVSGTSWLSPNFVITVTGNIVNATVDGIITPHPDPDVSQVGIGEGHGGAGTGYCNIYSSSSSVSIEQTLALVIGRKYRFSVNVNTVTSGGITIVDEVYSEWVSVGYTTTGIKTFTFVATHTDPVLKIKRRTGGGDDVTFDDVSIKLLAVEDSSGNDHDGLAQRQTSDLSVAGKINTAFDFNGTDYIEVGDIEADVKSIAMWVNPDAVNVTDYLIDLNGTDGIKIVNGTVTKIGFGSGTQIIYVDGVVASTVTANWHLVILTSTIGFDTNALDIGRVNGSGFFNGVLDNVPLFSLELDQSDVVYLWNNGQGREDWLPRELFLGRLNRPLDYPLRRGRYAF